LTVEQAGDTMKEYCNLIAGRVKRVLEDGHAKVGMSLPLTMRGFDRVYFEKVDGVNGYDWEWMIELGDTGSRVLFATAQVHLMDRAAFEQLHLGAGPALDVRAGEVSFLQDLEDSGEESGEGED
jgi:hypothetical protein